MTMLVAFDVLYTCSYLYSVKRLVKGGTSVAHFLSDSNVGLSLGAKSTLLKHFRCLFFNKKRMNINQPFLIQI